MKETVLTGYKNPLRSRYSDTTYGLGLFIGNRSIYSSICLFCKAWIEKLMLFRKNLIVGNEALFPSFPNPLFFTRGKPNSNLLSKSKSLDREMGDKILLSFFSNQASGQDIVLSLWISFDQVKTPGGELKVHSEIGISTPFAQKLP